MLRIYESIDELIIILKIFGRKAGDGNEYKRNH